ncbi:MAG: EAL domain-containing protein [Nitrosospira sp.]|nr:EAL domain-containing protein [Nitrosospira sp.]
MSLFRQLWLTVILVTLTSFTGGFVISMLGMQSHLEQQLQRKNLDSANFLAHSISQLSKDPATIGMQIEAFFNSGQYETISITSPEGNVIAERVGAGIKPAVPAWFVDLFPISTKAGSAQILDSWMHFGVIKVMANVSLAYESLWKETEALIIWFLAAGIFCALLGMLILQRINKPLAAMVDQAEAITERRFLTISEPRISELSSIARAINDLVRRLHNRTLEEASRLEALHQRINHDPITGLAHREYFMSLIGEVLEVQEARPGGEDERSGAYKEYKEDGGDSETGANGDDAASAEGKNTAPAKDEEAGNGVATPAAREAGKTMPDNKGGLDDERGGFLFLIRFNDLENINRKLGRSGTDELLRRAGSLIGNIACGKADNTADESSIESSGDATDHLAARLNGSDLVLVMPGIEEARQFADQLTRQLVALSSTSGAEIDNLCHIGAVQYRRGDKLAELLAGADTALATAERAGINAWHVIAPRSHPLEPAANIGDWRDIFGAALAENRFKLILFPVIGPSRLPLHQEAVVRMQARQDGGWLEAGDFITVAGRLNLTGPLDLAVARLALETLRAITGALAINLSIETISDWNYRNKLVDLLRPHPELCRRLWVEVPEYGAFLEFEAFRDFCATFKELGCRTGIEHFGRHYPELQKLDGLGLHYLKVDASFVHGINQNTSNQKFLRGLCGLTQSKGILAIAGGVQTEAERKTLIRLGFKGVTGPGVR